MTQNNFGNITLHISK